MFRSFRITLVLIILILANLPIILSSLFLVSKICTITRNAALQVVVEFRDSNFISKTLQLTEKEIVSNVRSKNEYGMAILVPVVLDVTEDMNGTTFYFTLREA